MKQRIPDQEDREFTTSQAHWTGDITWNTGPIGGKLGILEITCPGDGTHQIALLEYPYILPIKKKPNSGEIKIYTPGNAANLILSRLILTDGVYFTNPGYASTNIPDVWSQQALLEDIPDDWDEPSAQLILEAYNIGPDPLTIYLDDATITVPSKLDYLPLLGVA